MLIPEQPDSFLPQKVFKNFFNMEKEAIKERDMFNDEMNKSKDSTDIGFPLKQNRLDDNKNNNPAIDYIKELNDTSLKFYYELKKLREKKKVIYIIRD